MTGPAPDGWPHDPEGEQSSGPNSPAGPPGGRLFSLEGRPAPGLYLVAWILSIAGLALFLIGLLSGSRDAAILLATGGSLALTLGLATGAGYQVVERSQRPAGAYRGPSPLLAFAIYLFALNAVGFLLAALGPLDALDPDPLGFLLISLLQAAGYGVVVWLVAVRTGALSWAQMGWPAWQRHLAGWLRALAIGGALMVPLTFALLILGGILGALLGVEAPDVLPVQETSLDALLLLLSAAIVVPISEELFFRGFALTAWLRDLGARSALLRSAFFFALIHVVNISASGDREGLGVLAEGLSQTLLQTAVLLPAGLALGWLFLRYGMAAAIGAHATYNGLIVLLTFAAAQLPEAT